MKTKSVKVKAPKKGQPTQAVAATVQAPTKAAAQAPTPKKVTAEKPKRISLNPQPVLDAKTEALKAKGIKLTWSARAWHAGGKTFTSQEMSKYNVDEFSKLFPTK